MNKQKLTTLVLVAIAAVVLLFPVTWSICPTTQIKIADESGSPVAGCEVYQSWQFYGLSSEQHETQQADANGLVQFQARHTRFPILLYVLSRCASALSVHSSFGPYVWLETSKPGFQRCTAIYAKDFKDSKVLVQGDSLVWNVNLKIERTR